MVRRPQPPLPLPCLSLPSPPLRRLVTAALTALAVAGLAAPALGQDAATYPKPAPTAATPGDVATPALPALFPPADPAPAQNSTLDQLKDDAADASAGPVAFEADKVEYRSNSQLVVASGNVVLRRQSQSVRADSVTWDRNSGKIMATGNVRLVDPDGNQLYSDEIELTQDFKQGAITNMLLALREGGRLAAKTGIRDADGNIVLSDASYTACAIETSAGCPKTPSWRITAGHVIYDPKAKLVRFSSARIVMFGVSLLPLPSITIATDGRAIKGLLIPDLRLSASNGIELSETYYTRLANNRDLALTGYVYTKALPMISGQYRALNTRGAYQVTGYATRSRVISPLGTSNQTEFRGYLDANGKFQLSPEWSVTGSVRLASDRTFLRRYDISRDDRLRSTINVERIDANSYLSIAGWATQTLRVADRQGLVPIALPVIDYRRRLARPVLGGKVELQLNTLAITRTAGQDTQRAFVSAQWQARRLTTLGQEITLTGLVRGDIYHSDQNNLTTTAIYRGNPGWQARFVPTAALDIKWPLVGAIMGGTQVLTPRFQVAASPSIRNLEVPNEDSRAIDLEDSNLFAINRFPGYDRVEDGIRFTYGANWAFERPGLRIDATIGQSYRLSSEPTLFPVGTGLSSRVSDIVGRTEVRFRDIVKLTHRYRLDKSTLAVRRNEFDATIGSKRTYVELGYSRLNRNISTAIEDLKDSEELRAAARISFKQYWSVFGSGVFALGKATNQVGAVISTGFEPLRTRLGVAYQDDCLELGFTWRRDYFTTGDARKGNTFELHLALRNLGFR